jgi:LacI family transcriptional regulator
MSSGKYIPETEQSVNEWCLDKIIAPSHALVRLAETIDWRHLEARFIQTFVPAGEEHPLPIRLAVGLSILKQLYELPDEVLCQRWVENPYYQFFCGEKYLQHNAPFDLALISSLPPISDRRFRALFRECLSGTDADQGTHATGFPLDYMDPPSTEDDKPSPPLQEALPLAAGTAQKPASIYDVAKRARVSIKTVSLVINNRPNVSTKTRALVLQAIRDLSYHPNVFARGLASERSYLIALLYDHPSTGYISELQLGALDRCREAGYHLVVEPLSAHAEDLSKRMRNLIASSGLHGVILSPPLCDSLPIINELIRRQTPCVRISAGTRAAGFSTIGIDEKKGGYDVTAYLISLGHRRIGYIKGHPDHVAIAERFTGYRAALAAFNIPFDEEICTQGFFTFQSGKEAAEQMLAMDNRPTAIFAANDDMAAGAMVAAQRFNLKIPDDLSVVGFDDSMAAKIVWPQLTTCRQPVREMASTAVSMLLKKEGDNAPLDQHLKHELIVRASTASPAQ